MEWDYDSEADVLYISFGAPRPAVGVDMGNGVIMRYDENTGELVGITIVWARTDSLVSTRTHSHTVGIATTKAAPDRNCLTKIP